MENVIGLFNPSDLPFGPLSNNAFHVMQIDGKSWSSVTNYVYANMMCNNAYKNVVAEQKTTRNVKEVAMDLYRRCLDENWVKGMRVGIEAKFRDPELRARLLNTGNAFFRYVSGNPLLGVTPDGQGQNSLGIELQNLRKKIRIGLRRAAREETERARPMLQQPRRFAEPSDIIEPLEYEEENSCCFYTKEDDSIAVCTSQENCPRPLEGWLQSGKLELEGCSPAQCTERRKAIIFDAWTTYMIKKNFPQVARNNRIDDAKAQQFAKLSGGELAFLMSRVEKLYNLDKLEQEVKGEIQEIIRETVALPPGTPPLPPVRGGIVPEPDGIQVADIEVEGVAPLPAPIPTAEPDLGLRGEVELIVITDNPRDPNFWLSPLYPKQFEVDTYTYHTLLHFIMAYIIEKVFQHTKTNAHVLVAQEQAQNIRILSLIFERVKEQSWIDLLAKYVRISIDAKFRDKKLQDLLLRTGDSKIEFRDHTDPVLGVGQDGTGMDITGNYLMRLRGLIRDERGEEGAFRGFINVAQLIGDNPDMIRWLDQRTGDIIRTSAILQKYVQSKLPRQQEV